MKNSNIEWTDHTFNPWMGCMHKVQWGPGYLRQRTSEKYWEDPLDWNAAHEAFFAEHGRRQKVFCASLADVFDNEVPGLWRQHLMSLVAKTPNLDWLFLTKRIGNARKMLTEASMHDGLLLTADDQYRPPANLWIGATITSQAEADRDIPKLLATPAAKRFLSMEPLLGNVALDELQPPGASRTWIDSLRGTASPMGGSGPTYDLPRLDWVIVGGESGPNARPMHPDWARSLRDQCQAAGVPFLFKQWGEWAPVAREPIHPEALKRPGNLCRVEHINQPDHYAAVSFTGNTRHHIERVGKKAAGRMLDGRTWDEVPA